MTRYLQLMKMKTLPPLVSAVVWDVINDRLDELTIRLAQATTQEDFEQYDLIRCVVAADPKHPPVDLAKGLVDARWLRSWHSCSDNNSSPARPEQSLHSWRAPPTIGDRCSIYPGNLSQRSISHSCNC